MAFSSALAAHAYIFMQTHFKFAFGPCTTSWLCAGRKQGFNLCGLTPTSTLKFDYEVLNSSELKIAKWNTIKTNEFSLAWCQKVRETAHFARSWSTTSWEHFKSINHSFRRLQVSCFTFASTYKSQIWNISSDLNYIWHNSLVISLIKYVLHWVPIL